MSVFKAYVLPLAEGRWQAATLIGALTHFAQGATQSEAVVALRQMLRATVDETAQVEMVKAASWPDAVTRPPER